MGEQPARGDVMGHSAPLSEHMASRPEWLRERLQWFLELKFGMIIHWGPYAQWDCCESWPLVPEDEWARNDDMRCWTERGKDLERFQRDYWALNRTFNPTEFDPGSWADAAVLAGMTYVVFTTKHHDGFCMWDTKTTAYRVTHPDCPFSSDPRADIVREIFDAFRARGLRIGAYFSKSDWHSPYYWSPDFAVRDRNPNYNTAERPELWGQFVAYVHAQIHELMTGYGPIDLLWLDGGQVRPPSQDIDMPRLASMARELQPGLIIVDRTVGGAYEDYITPEHMIPDEPLSAPWESCIPLGSGWKHNPLGMTYRPAASVIEDLRVIMALGGNLLLGVGPSASGVLDAEAHERLAEIGDYLQSHPEVMSRLPATQP